MLFTQIAQMGAAFAHGMNGLFFYFLNELISEQNLEEIKNKV